MDNSPARHPAFEYYDPFTDTVIDPPTAEGLFQHPGLPPWLHDAVARAKQLTGPLEHAALEAVAHRVDRMAAEGVIANAQRLDAIEAAGRDYAASDESDCLRAYLDSDDCAEPLKTWPGLFGVLALRLAGDVLRELQSVPPGDAAETRSQAESLHRGSEAAYSKSALQGTVEALRAVAVGEGIAASLRELHRKKVNRANARNAPKGKADIKSLYVDWVGRLGESHTYRRQSHAEEDFLKWLASERPDLTRHVSESTARTLRKHLRNHCEQAGTPYPFALDR